MKKIFSLCLVAMMCCFMALPASAADINTEYGLSRSVISAEIQNEVVAAEAALATPCVMAEEKISEAGEYIMVSRLYVAEDPMTARGVNTIGALSAVTWYKRGASDWTYKVQLAGWFDYDGTTAECVDDDFTVVDASYDDVAYYAEWRYLSGDVAAVNVYCEISDEDLPATLMVTCTKDGELGYTSDNRYF